MPIQLAEKPIFVIGAERSGTTLLMCLIGAHPRLAVPEVGWLYPRFHPYLYSYGDLSRDENLRTLAFEMVHGLNQPYWGMKVDPATIVDEILAAVRERSFAGIYCALHERYAREQGKPRWGQKTPQNAHFIGAIKADFPNAQFIYITRDGRDAAAEALQSAFGPKHIYAAAKNWALDVNAAKPWRKTFSRHEWMDLRYEDLVRDPGPVLQAVCAFLAERFAPEMLDFHTGEIAVKRGKTRDHAPLGSAVSDKYVGVYKRHLSLVEQEIFAAVAGNELAEAGYASDVAPCAIAPAEAALYEERDGRIRAAMLDSPGGHIVAESYRDWLAEQREERRKRGVWAESDRVNPLPAEHEDHITGMRAAARWKRHFAVKRRLELPTGAR